MSRKLISFLLLISAGLGAADRRARNVILFLGDAGGLPVLNAAAAHKGKAQSLYIHQMPHIGLMDTSTATGWVTDSAAGMSAIVTGQKTRSGIISQSDAAVRGKSDGEILKTILEHAEERGLSTGVVTNDKVTGATPAACYSHVNDRKKSGEIFAQLLMPRFGDGVDLLIGPGGSVLADASAAVGTDVEAGLKANGYTVLSSIDALKPDADRAIILLENDEFDIEKTVRRAVAILSRNRKGYFLMVEVDLHTDKLKRGLDRTLLLDRVIEDTVRTVGKDTLVIFTADHSFDTRTKGGKKGDDLLALQPGSEQKPSIRVDDGHTGEEVVAAGHGPGAERIKGFFPNTMMFDIMMSAYGWAKPSKQSVRSVTEAVAN